MQRAFGEQEAPLAAERWDWLFGTAPADAAGPYLLADAGERLAGQYATVPVRLQHRGEPTRGLLMVDMATDPAYRHQGVFTALARAIYDGSAAEYPIVFGFPNTTAAPIHYGQFGWVELRPFPLLVRPLADLGAALAAQAPKLAPIGRPLDALLWTVGAIERTLVSACELGSARVLALDRFCGWTDELWAGMSGELGTCVIRDAAYLNWRFCSSPYRYRRYALHRHGRPVGFAVIAFETTPLGRLCHLMELMAPKEDRAGALLLLLRAYLEAAREGACALCAIATRRHPHRRTMLGSGLLPAPRRLRARWSFGVRHNGAGATPNDLFHIDDWYLSGADRDTI